MNNENILLDVEPDVADEDSLKSRYKAYANEMKKLVNKSSNKGEDSYDELQ